MRRMQLVELEDLAWFPAVLRDLATDYLQIMLHVSNPYAPVASRLRKALDAAGERRILDLASGGSGPWARLLPLLAADGASIHVTLTDRTRFEFEEIHRFANRSPYLHQQSYVPDYSLVWNIALLIRLWHSHHPAHERSIVIFDKLWLFAYYFRKIVHSFT